MQRVLFGLLAFVLGVALVASPAVSQPPGGKDGKDGKGGGKDGKGLKSGFKLGSALPPTLVEDLKLTDDQKAKLQEIEKDLKGKLDKLLTDDQKKVIENFAPAGPGGPGPKGGKGPPPPMGKGGPGEKGGKGDEKLDRPPLEKAPPPVEKNSKGDDKNSQVLPPANGPVNDEVSVQWYATLSRGLAEAKRTGKPILFVSAAPHCAGVSGMW